LSVTVCLRLNRSLFKKMVRADSLWWIQNAVTLCFRNQKSVSVFLGIHDVIHRIHTNIDVIGDRLDTLGTWEKKSVPVTIAKQTQSWAYWVLIRCRSLGWEGGLENLYYWLTPLPETSYYIHLVVTKRRVVWWIITDCAKERIVVIPMCHVVQQQRRKKMGFSETSGTTQKTRSSVTPLWDNMVRITQQTGSAHSP
jgi:hypothetical protein